MIAKALHHLALRLKLMGDWTWRKWGRGDLYLRRRGVVMAICEHVEAIRVKTPQGVCLLDLDGSIEVAHAKLAEAIKAAVMEEDYETAEVLRDFSASLVPVEDS